MNFLNLHISDHISIHEQYYTDLTTENESSALGQEVYAWHMMSYDVTGTKWLPGKGHPEKYVSHRIFEIYLVKSSNYMPVYYIIWRNFCAYIEVLTRYTSQDMLHLSCFIVANVLAIQFFLFLRVKKRFLVF